MMKRQTKIETANYCGGVPAGGFLGIEEIMLSKFDADVGFTSATLCTTLSLSQATWRLNCEYGTGTPGDWVSSEEPQPCDTNPETHMHFTFEC